MPSLLQEMNGGIHYIRSGPRCVSFDVECTSKVCRREIVKSKRCAAAERNSKRYYVQ